MNGKRPHMQHAPRHLHVKATRGPISYEFLRRRGYDVSQVKAMFDPACLLPHVFAPEIAALRAHVGNPPTDFILIPHFRDDAVMRLLYPAHVAQIVSVDTPFFEMVARMLRANLVISSSLHGLIVAEALGIPAVWHRPLMGEDELKFNDYYLATDRYRIIRAETLHEALRVSPMALPVVDHAMMLASFPTHAELDAHGLISRPQPLPATHLIHLNAALPGSLRLVTGWAKPEPHGVWSDGTLATVDLFVGHAPAADQIIELFMKAFVPTPGQTQRFTLADGERDLGTYELNDQRPFVLRLRVGDLARVNGTVGLSFHIPTSFSPVSIGLNQDRRRLGLALRAIRLSPAELETVLEPLLHLSVAGRAVMPSAHTEGRYVFDLPAIDGPVRVISRVSHYYDRPSATLGLSDCDERELGVTIENVTVTTGDGVQIIAADDKRLSYGWHPLQQIGDQTWRWTDGDALLPIGASGAARIEIESARTGFYGPDDGAKPLQSALP